jgi:hypothetical protein
MRRLGLAALVTGLLAALAGPAGASGKIHVQPIVNFALPPATAGCGGNTLLSGGAQRLSITVSKVDGQVAEMINVCLKGSGPYPFIIDTGAGESVIDAHLAQRLHLVKTGPTNAIEGVGCQGNATPVKIPSWSAAGATLDPQTLTSGTLPDFGKKGQPVGLLGSDVLSRFGAVRIDFTNQTLTLGAAEGPPDSGNQVTGPTGPAPGAVLTNGETGTTVPATSVLIPGAVALEVNLRLGRNRSHTFVVDTGSSQSVVSSALAKKDHLAHTNQAQRQTTVCSTITSPLDQSGPWSVPGVTLYRQDLGVVSFGPISDNGTAGLLGSDQLQRFGWVIFDYSGGRLVLG